MNLLDTLSGSMLETFFPAGWNLRKIDACCSHPPEEIGRRQGFWHREFHVVPCETIHDFNTMLGHEIAREIQCSRDEGKPLALILPVGPMGMYRWVVYFLREWNVDCRHVYGFNMDEWSDAEGNTLPPEDPGSFQRAMQEAFYGPLGKRTVPRSQRNFATRKNLPTYPGKIAAIKARGGRVVTVFGIGRVFHVAFWEPHFAAEFRSVEEWTQQTWRLGAKLHPLTIEQNAITSFKSRMTLVPCCANTIGPGIFLPSDRVIGGCDGQLGRGMQWQGVSLWVTLRYGPNMWVPSSFLPTRPGTLFYLRSLAGPLTPECH